MYSVKLPQLLLGKIADNCKKSNEAEVKSKRGQGATRFRVKF